MPLKLTYYGNPVLRKKAAPVKKVTAEIKQLIKDMFETMHIQNGIGLAGPQVDQLLSIFVCEVPVQDEEGNWEPGEPRVFINPKILEYSDEEDLSDEGCLSIPGLRGEVWRPTHVTVEALDVNGKKFKISLSGLEARNAFHEIDHLNGTLYIDRMDKKERKKIEKTLRDIKKKYN